VVGSLQFSLLLAIQPSDGCITNRLFINYNVDLEHEDSETGAWFDLSEQ
jgi:hypothetical protein